MLFIKEFGKEYTKLQTANVLKTHKIKPEVYQELLNFKEGDDISKLSKEAKTYLTKHKMTLYFYLVKYNSLSLSLQPQGL